MNNTEAIFAETVSILETSHNHPYLFDEDISSFADVADELDRRGFRNSKGKKLTDNSLRVMFHRLDEETRALYHERYYPEMWSKSDLEYRHDEKTRKATLQFHPWEVDAWKSDYQDTFTAKQDKAFNKYCYSIFKEESGVL